MAVKMSLFSKVLIIFYGVLVIWWMYIWREGLQDETSNYLFGAAFSIMPLVAGIVGIKISARWGYMRSYVGKFIIFLSLGLITWAVGTLIFAYYNFFLDVEVPYPSIADAAYIVSWPLWALAMVNLSYATGMKFKLRQLTGKLLLFAIPLSVALISYYLLFIVARGGVMDYEGGLLKLFFDFAYPIGDVLILTLSLLLFGLSFNYLGGTFKLPIMFVLFGFVLNYIADFSFSYTTTVETFYVASWVDLLFTTTMFILSLGLSFFSVSIKSEKQ